MRLRTRLALVLVALVLVPLVAAAVLVTYAVPTRRGRPCRLAGARDALGGRRRPDPAVRRGGHRRGRGRSRGGLDVAGATRRAPR